MLLFLIFILTVASIALRITIGGLEVAYVVAKRAEQVRRFTTSAVITARGVKRPDTYKRNKLVNKGINTVTNGIGLVAKGAKSIVILSIKATLKLIRFIISRVRDALVALSTTVLILDIVVFLILVSASAGYLVLYSTVDENGNIVINEELQLGNTGSTTKSNEESTEQTSTSTGNFTKYELSTQEYLQIARLCYQEQGSPRGAAAEASLMCNRFEMYGSGYSSLTDYVRNSRWFARAGHFMDEGSAPDEVLKVVTAVLRDGKRTLPGYVDEHDCFSDFESVTNNGVGITITDRSQYQQYVTVCNNRYGSSYIFYCFPQEHSDPFGYISAEKRTEMGDDCYDIDTLLKELGIEG